MEAFDMTYDGTANVLFGPYNVWPAAQIKPVRRQMERAGPHNVGHDVPAEQYVSADHTATVQLHEAWPGSVQHAASLPLQGGLGLIYEHVMEMAGEQQFLYMLRPLFPLISSGRNLTYEPPYVHKIVGAQVGYGKSSDPTVENKGSRSEYP
ncbi:hypothetical protein RRG08_004098 [Elysia crispata]|uniref:Uncharacterized protein n=1 Tax=Elysia crispata TaxID=231223 RepID=A0AAE1AYX9_9GAST|nr:hypothetical protein RRG08_004098 [Elysia crispata]